MEKNELRKENIKAEENNNKQLYKGIWKVEYENKEKAKVKVNKNIK